MVGTDEGRSDKDGWDDDDGDGELHGFNDRPLHSQVVPEMVHLTDGLPDSDALLRQWVQ